MMLSMLSSLSPNALLALLPPTVATRIGATSDSSASAMIRLCAALVTVEE